MKIYNLGTILWQSVDTYIFIVWSLWLNNYSYVCFISCFWFNYCTDISEQNISLLVIAIHLYHLLHKNYYFKMCGYTLYKQYLDILYAQTEYKKIINSDLLHTFIVSAIILQSKLIIHYWRLLW